MDSDNAQQGDKLRYTGAAVVTGLSVNTLQSMVCRRQIPHFRLGKRLVVFSRKELEDWLERRRVRSP